MSNPADVVLTGEGVSQSFTRRSLRNRLNRYLGAVIILQLCALATSTGCHRGFYRRQADVEAQRLITEKATDPRWSSADGRLDIDPQSRMFDPFSADHAPIPPDDPSSHKLMHCVDGRAGYPHWHANGDTDFVAAPQWQSYLPIGPDGKTTISLERAFELARIHSPLFQQQRETLYLSALDVSLQRFGFDAQLFAGFNNFITSQGRLRSPTGRSATNLSSTLGANGEGLSLSKLGVTGATFTAGLANTLIFNLAGNNTQSASSLFDFSIIQPLLANAGRERILESLTQSERTLLANVRQYERFRRGFYLQVAIGRAPGAGPNLNGNFLGLPSGANLNAGGYFGLLQQQQLIRNLEFNLRLLEGVLEQFRTFREEDRIDELQVRQFESTVFQQQQNLLNAKVAYQTSLDTFKQTLGLPPALEVVINDPYLDEFKIIGDSISGRLSEISRLRIETGAVIDELVDFKSATQAQDESDVDIDIDIEEMISTTRDLKPLIDKALQTIKSVRENDYVAVEKDIQTLKTTRPDRIAYLRQLRREIASGKLPSEVEPQVFGAASIPEAADLLNNLSSPDNKRSVFNRLISIGQGLDKLEMQLAGLDEVTDELSADKVATYIEENFQQRIPDLLTDLDGTILELALLQAEARSNTIEIPKVGIGSDQAFEIARCFRRDLMNARASLVDNWRVIEFVADQLESQVDLVFDGDIGNVGDNPFNVRFDNGQLRAGFRFDSPIVRQSERNDYREALIIYQQSRRQFYQFEDEVSGNLRQVIRDIDRNKVLFELNRQNIQVNIDAVELSRFRLEQPPRAGSDGSFNQTTARDLTQAITGLNTVQNQYVQAFVQYEILRRSLDFDMGTMQLDQGGQWLDPGTIDSSIGVRTAAVLGIDSNCEFCQNIDSFSFEDEDSRLLRDEPETDGDAESLVESVVETFEEPAPDLEEPSRRRSEPTSESQAPPTPEPDSPEPNPALEPDLPKLDNLIEPESATDEAALPALDNRLFSIDGASPRSTAQTQTPVVSGFEARRASQVSGLLKPLSDRQISTRP